jgi:ATP-binding cassette subfamily F protein 3
LRTLLGQVAPLEGQASLGYNVRVGYFAQAQEGLKPERTVLEEILETKNLPLGEARGFLGRFLFSGDDVFKPIATLSGGERARVALAKLTLQGANLLLLDEPTNHLDIPSQEALQEVLELYTGTILFVTHDRWLVGALATQVWLLEGDRLRAYPGGYAEYVAAREQEAAAAKASRPAVRQPPVPRPAEGAAARERQRRAQSLAALEQEIDALEAQLRDLEERISRASQRHDLDQVRLLSAEYAAVEAALEGRMATWSRAQTEQAAGGQ